jgi:hypothetical protein
LQESTAPAVNHSFESWEAPPRPLGEFWFNLKLWFFRWLFWSSTIFFFRFQQIPVRAAISLHLITLGIP